MKSNYSFGCSTSMPNGCLLNPEGSRIIFFEECKNSHKLKEITFFIKKTKLLLVNKYITLKGLTAKQNEYNL